MIDVHEVPPEMGGMIGRHDRVVDVIVMDHGIAQSKEGVYAPNTEYLDHIIEQWENVGISFAGIFHTHAPQWPDLSNGDIEYIQQICQAMPLGIDTLYFPLVFPPKSFKAYVARRVDGNVYITEDDIEII